jgi:acetyl esterase/lipase
MTRIHAMSTALMGALAIGLGGANAVAQPMSYSGASPSEPPPPFPKSSIPAPVNAPDMQAVLDAQARMGSKPTETLSPAEARVQPTGTDGVHAVMKRKGLPVEPDPGVGVKDVGYGDDPLQIARIYTPVKAAAALRPMIVYYPGGGFVFDDLTSNDATPQLLARRLDAVVVSVDYRKAPEAKFPAQHEDAARAYAWALKKAKTWGADPTRTAVAGESAGGNLAVATAIFARDHGLTAPVHILSIYPIANSSMSLPSRVDSANAKALDTATLSWFTHYWARSDADPKDPRINLVAADLHGLPPTTIINARNDPLRSDGETLAVAMRAAGDRVEQRTFPGVTHDFFDMGEVVETAGVAETFAVDRLRPALAPH